MITTTIKMPRYRTLEDESRLIFIENGLYDHFGCKQGFRNWTRFRWIMGKVIIVGGGLDITPRQFKAVESQLVKLHARH